MEAATFGLARRAAGLSEKCLGHPRRFSHLIFKMGRKRRELKLFKFWLLFSPIQMGGEILIFRRKSIRYMAFRL